MKQIKFIIIGFCFLLSGIFAAEALKDDDNVVRVGFPIQSKLTYIDENGDYAGYTVDYLEQISLYTDWEYEYVEVDGDLNEQLSTLLMMLKDGEIDILGAMNYNEALEKMYLYPSYHYGTAYTTLVVRDDNQEFMEEDYKNWNGMTVAVYEGLEYRLKLLEQYAQVNGFTFETIEYNTVSEVVNAVRNGEADATLQVDISTPSGLKSIARFSPTPYYFALYNGNTKMLQQLNAALNDISQSYPHLSTELYNKYFSFSNSFYISNDDMEYIENLGTVKVLFFDGNAPFQYEKDGQIKGIAAAYLDQFAEKTGLKYEPVIASTYEEGLSMLEDGLVDIVACLPTNSDIIAFDGLQLSLPFFTSRSIVVSTHDVRDREYGNIENSYLTTEHAMNELRNDSEHSIFLDTYSVNFYLQKGIFYDNLVIDWSTSDSIFYSVATVNTDMDNLVNILSNYANSYTEEDRQTLLYIYSHDTIEYTLSEFLYIYQYYFLIGFIFIILIACILVLMRRNRKAEKNRRMRFAKFSNLVNECIFEYDYKKDTLYIQNGDILFHGKTEIVGFMHQTLSAYWGLSDIQSVEYELMNILQKRLSQTDVQINENDQLSWYRITIQYISDDASDYAIGRIADFDKDIKQKLELETRANHDILTGLLNRVALENYLDSYLTTNRRDGAMLLLDLDNFKRINDECGHLEGDKLLQSFANYLKSFFPENNLKIRLGGDEFLIFIPNAADPEQLSVQIEQLISNLKSDVFAQYAKYHLSVSIGVCYMDDEHSTYQHLYRAADEAMYKAKRNGKDQFYIRQRYQKN